jgi:hypothetical protein
MRTGRAGDDESGEVDCAGNVLVGRFDVFGLFVAPPGTADTRGLEELGKCLGIAARRAQEIKRLAKQGRLHQNSDKWFHCVTSCEITRECGAGMAQAMGNVWEWLYPGGTTDTWLDQLANQDGRNCGDCKEKRSCEQCCQDKGYAL